MLAVGCEASIGDKCETSNDCPSGTVCDLDSPGGYCLAPNCEADNDCPSGSVCVFFTPNISYCMEKCKKDKDCDRSGYKCREDIGTSKFCYIPAEYPYGRDENNRIEYDAP